MRHRGTSASGYSLVELLIVLGILSLILGTGASAWFSTRRGPDSIMAARTINRYLTQARMLAVYRARNHFLVLNPTTRTIEIYADSGTTASKFDNGDALVRAEHWPESVSIALPPSVSSVPNPLGGSALTAGWSLPAPDSTARWGSALLGVMATPSGRIQSAESTPATIAAGVMVLSDNFGSTTSVGVRGQFGTVQSFQLLDSGWVIP